MASGAAQALAEHAELVDRLSGLLPTVDAAARHMIEVYERGGRVFTFGNGGSAAEAQHLAGELVGRYTRDRRPLPAAALVGDAAVATCIANDFGFDDLFARQVRAFAGAEDLVVAFTTSGRSENVRRGLEAARATGATSIAFTGGAGPVASLADYALAVPSSSTARIQEMHVLLVHVLIEEVDRWAAA